MAMGGSLSERCSRCERALAWLDPPSYQQASLCNPFQQTSPAFTGIHQHVLDGCSDATLSTAYGAHSCLRYGCHVTVPNPPRQEWCFLLSLLHLS